MRRRCGHPKNAKARSPAEPRAGKLRLDWVVVEQVRQAVKVPVVLKGIMTADEAKLSVDKGAQGIIVSNRGGRFAQGFASPIEVLPSIVDAVGSPTAVMIDGRPISITV